MLKHNVKKIVYSSSAAIFGELQSDNIDENHPLNPDSP
jgi:UDP-glucose 4-epimerase